MSFHLAFETSTAMGEVALGRDTHVLAAHPLSAPRRHAAEFIPAVAQLCREHGVAPNQIDAVFVSIGPGSFTGLRIGVTAARILNLTTGCPLVPVPTLDVVAQNALEVDWPHTEQPTRDPRIAVILDAKRGRVFTSTFTRSENRFVADAPPVETDPLRFLTECITQHGHLAVLGEGVWYHREAIEAAGAVILPERLFLPRASVVYRLGLELLARGHSVHRRDVTPTYVRPPEAEEKWAQRNLPPDGTTQ